MAQDLASEFVADLYRRERLGIARSVARIAGESHAEDLVHDAFVAYLTKSPWATKPGAWVATVARNRALNERRGPKLVSIEDNTVSDRIEDPAVERDAIRSVVAQALSSLSEREITALRMKFFESAEYDSIAQALSVRVPQAHVIVHRALRRLGRELVHRMADAHGAASCVPALLRMAGLGVAQDTHADLPCTTCAPAWDEIVSLRIGAWMPAPLLSGLFAIKHRTHQSLAWIARRMNPSAADSLSKAAACLAIGVAVAATPPIVVRHSPSPVERRSGNTATYRSLPESETVTGRSGNAGSRTLAPVRSSTNAIHGPRHNMNPNTRTHANTNPQAVDVSSDSLGGVVVCPQMNQSCGH